MPLPLALILRAAFTHTLFGHWSFASMPLHMHCVWTVGADTDWFSHCQSHASNLEAYL